jgi:hypothetical protein
MPHLVRQDIENCGPSTARCFLDGNFSLTAVWWVSSPRAGGLLTVVASPGCLAAGWKPESTHREACGCTSVGPHGDLILRQIATQAPGPPPRRSDGDSTKRDVHDAQDGQPRSWPVWVGGLEGSPRSLAHRRSGRTVDMLQTLYYALCKRTGECDERVGNDIERASRAHGVDANRSRRPCRHQQQFLVSARERHTSRTKRNDCGQVGVCVGVEA